MDYNPGGASPDHIGDGSVHLVCECGYADDYSPDDADSGFFSCRQCSALHPIQATAADPYDFHPTGNLSFHRVATQPTITPKRRTPAPYLTPHTPHLTPLAAAAAAPVFDDFDEPSKPRDFAPDADACFEHEDLAARIRWCYVQGLQMILQRQLEVLVERFRVGALVCGIAGTIWVRWVAASKVFDEVWAHNVLADHERRMHLNVSPLCADDKKPDEGKNEWEDGNLPPRRDRCRVEFAFLRSLRMMLPVYSTLAVCFLACHVAREAILPTDIYKWAMESKIPYMAAFTDIRKQLSGQCPLDARQLLRPVRIIGAWQLETAAGSIAEKIGLRLPSVNFYVIALRCLKDMSLPLDRIIPQACRIYEWVMPAELWLSSNPSRIPTRVCVMAILIVAVRLLYNINGQGIWEEICEEKRNTAGSDSGASSPPFMSPGGSNSEEFGIRELLCTVAASYDKINVRHDYSNDLQSYLKYCSEVFFSGITFLPEEQHLIEIFLDLYKGREDEHSTEQSQCHVEMPISNGMNKRFRDGTFVEASSFSSSVPHDALQLIKSEMLDHGFHYMAPRKPRKSDGYLRYRRRKLIGGFVYVAHADYYMLLRAFAKLAEVDVRIMHTSVLKLERRLACIEERIERSLNTLQNLPSETKDEPRPTV